MTPQSYNLAWQSVMEHGAAKVTRFIALEVSAVNPYTMCLTQRSRPLLSRAVRRKTCLMLAWRARGYRKSAFSGGNSLFIPWLGFQFVTSTLPNKRQNAFQKYSLSLYRCLKINKRGFLGKFWHRSQHFPQVSVRMPTSSPVTIFRHLWSLVPVNFRLWEWPKIATKGEKLLNASEDT